MAANTSKLVIHLSIAEKLRPWVFFTSLMFVAYSQGQQTQPERIADAVKNVKQGNFARLHVEVIARAGAVDAIPALRAEFARRFDPNRTDEVDDRAKIASALVRLGEKDEVYWDFLLNQASAALSSDVPFPTRFDAEGKAVPHQLAPEFAEWTQANHVSPESAGQLAVYELPLKLKFLAETGDPRGIPLLRQAMSSPNYMIEAVAAKGLAKQQDKASIPIIVAACRKAPRDIAAAIAEALVFFDDAEAQTEATKFLPGALFKLLHEAKQVPGNDAFYH
jgi:hypothetical protein